MFEMFMYGYTAGAITFLMGVLAHAMVLDCKARRKYQAECNKLILTEKRANLYKMVNDNGRR